MKYIPLLTALLVLYLGPNILWTEQAGLSAYSEFDGWALSMDVLVPNGERPVSVVSAGLLVDQESRFAGILGVGWWSRRVQELGSRNQFYLGVRYKISENLLFRIVHWSCANFCEPNVGEESLSLLWRF